MNELKKIIKNKIDNHILVWLDRFLDRPNIKNGLIEKTRTQIYKSGDYIHNVLGATNSRVIKKDGDFEEFIPVGEQQNKPFEKMWCVSENGTCNVIETDFNYFIHLVNTGKADEDIKELVKIFRHFGLIKGDKCLLDTAYVAVGSGTTKRGNSMNKPCDFIRHYGLIPKGTYPPYTTWNELYYPSGGVYINGNKMPAELLEQGKKLVEFVDITYEWVRPQDMDNLMEKGAMGTSCYAWLYPDKNGVYQRVDLPKNHSVYKFKKKDKDHKKIGDSYNPFIKKLALDYDLGWGMLISYGLKKKFSIFNEELIKNFKEKRGIDYLLLVETYKDFLPGLYEIKNNNLVKIELPQAVDEWIKGLANEGKLIGINKEDFSKFLT